VVAVIEAAGGVVWRVGARGPKVLLVHRPRYDDWSLPKGKLDAGESALDAALREVHEETGLVCDVGLRLPDATYVHRSGRRKRVRYWTMTVVTGEGDFTPNREVDATRWFRIADAANRLSYDHDMPVLSAFADLALTG
jgi:8-oxo-dGTP diphosphatase